MGSVKFGENIEASAVIRDNIRAAPQLGSVQTQMLLRDRYETLYGIYNYDLERDRPMALVALHPPEEAAGATTLYERIDQFGEKNVFKYFGLSFKEFMELPTDMCLRILEACNRLKTSEGQATEDALARLQGGKT